MNDLDDLRDISSRLRRAGIVHALGGSGLLHCLGFDVRPDDWDLLTEADEADVLEALDGLTLQRKGPSPRFPSDYLLQITTGQSRIEIIGHFRIATPNGKVSVPTRVAGEFHGIPLGHPEDWIRAYRTISQGVPASSRDDRDKIELLEQYLADRDGQQQ